MVLRNFDYSFFLNREIESAKLVVGLKWDNKSGWKSSLEIVMYTQVYFRKTGMVNGILRKIPRFLCTSSLHLMLSHPVFFPGQFYTDCLLVPLELDWVEANTCVRAVCTARKTYWLNRPQSNAALAAFPATK